MCNVVGQITLDAKSTKEFKEKIDDEYRVNMYGILQFLINMYLLPGTSIDCLSRQG